MLIYKVCSVFGHWEIDVTDDLETRLREKFEDMIVNENYGIFYFGGFGQFDALCHKIISELKKKYPHIRRVFCLSDPRHQISYKRPRWLKDEDYEEFVYLSLSFDYWYQRIYFRNIEMINQSDFVIFYVKHTKESGAYKAMKYAIKKKKDFLNMVEIEE